jgi:hypothetical protein
MVEELRFWEDLWLGDKPLCKCSSRLYGLTFSKNVLISDVFNSDWSVINFRRNLWDETAAMRQELLNLCANVNLVEEDRCRWLLTKSGNISVKSMYLALKMGAVKWKHRNVWSVKIPLKMKVFVWLAFNKNILTKDVLMRRGIQIPPPPPPTPAPR